MTGAVRREPIAVQGYQISVHNNIDEVELMAGGRQRERPSKQEKLQMEDWTQELKEDGWTFGKVKGGTRHCSVQEPSMLHAPFTHGNVGGYGT